MKNERAEADRDPRLDLEIDRNRLDDEWVRQPLLRFEYGELLATAKEQLLQAKSERSVTEAELLLDIRNYPKKYELIKATDKSVEGVIPLQSEYIQADKRVRHFQHEVEVLEAAVIAIDHRKKALEDLVELHLAGYFGAPRAPEAARERMDGVEKRAVRRKGRRGEQ